MRSEIVALHRRLGATMIYVTHDQVEAMTMADTIVVLRDGIVEQVGSPLELYARPRNRFVAGFLGAPQMNMLAATWRGVSPSGLKLAVDERGLACRVDVAAGPDRGHVRRRGRGHRRQFKPGRGQALRWGRHGFGRFM